jgi:hypothetical protein
LLAGTLPIGASYINAKRNLNLDVPQLPALTKTRPDLPASVDAIIDKALRRHPEERQGSVDELLSEFEEAMRERQ